MTSVNEREQFDQYLEKLIAALPPDVRELLEEVPLIVEDEPSPKLLKEMGIEVRLGESDLCGLHSGVPLDERSVMSQSEGLEQIYLFRGPIFRLADWRPKGVEKQIRITLLHELAHRFGFDEEELKALGYD